jgi:copper transport protein
MAPRLTTSTAALVFATTLAVVVTPPAAAHATLLQTEPAAGRVAKEPPARVVLTFDEPVEAPAEALRVYDGAGRRVDRGEVLRPSPQSTAIDLEDVLRRGTYTVAWRVISADSDPIRGAFVFHVQRPGAHPGGIAAEVLEDTPRSVSVAFDVARFLEYAFLLLAAGGALCLTLVIDRSARNIRAPLYAAIGCLAAGLAVVSLLELPLQGAATAGIGLGHGFSRDIVGAVAETRYGNVALVRVVVAAALAVVAVAAARRAGRVVEAAVLALAAVALATPVAVSHASVSGRLATLADASHIAAAAAWVGGLAFLAAALALARTERWQLATSAVPRFSKVAVVAVAVVIAGGIVNGYLQVRSWSALWETTYGRLLLAKIALLLPLLGLGAFNNRFAVPRLRAAVASAVERRRFLRAISGELALMTTIVAVTAVLVGAPPARTHVTSHAPSAGEVAVGPYRGTVRVDPARAGPNTVRVVFTHEDVPVDVRLSATLPARNLGPLRFPVQHTAHSTFTARQAQFPLAGEWRLRIEARQGEFDLFTRTVPVQIEETR